MKEELKEELYEKAQNKTDELTDDELDNVAGGSGNSFKWALAETWNTSRKKLPRFINDD